MNDYHDDYEEEEEETYTEEDEVAMRKGLQEVNRRMGPNSRYFTTKDAEDALWNSYYDANKAIKFLTNKFVPKDKVAKPPPPAQAFSVSGKPKFLVKDFFFDMPWLRVPQDRQTTFIEPVRPRGGLLGGGEGGGKMSKLQALAAKRKQEKQDKQTAQDMASLSIAKDSQKEISGPIPEPASNSIGLDGAGSPDNGSSIFVHSQSSSPAEIAQSDNAVNSTEERPAFLTFVSRSEPSSFARTLCGLAPDSAGRRPEWPEQMPLPYVLSHSYSPKAFEKPSPDDVVLAAQARAGSNVKASLASASPKPKIVSEKGGKREAGAGDAPSAKLASLKIAEELPRSKGLDVLKLYEEKLMREGAKKNASFVVVGHVDAGKSTLMGKLLLDLKVVEKHTADKYRRQAEALGKESFALAWIMDQRTEERNRGVTIDIATNYFETEKTTFTILDAPGHKDFVPNMIAGASQADFAILVVDASTGAFERGIKGQTREHVLLLRSLGVQKVVVAVNKLDTIGWSRDRFDEISDQTRVFAVGLGFQGRNLQFVPISGLRGDNLTYKLDATKASWYTGPTLLEALEESVSVANLDLRRPFRLGISEIVHSPKGTVMLFGRLECGNVQIGDHVVILPQGETGHIKSIMVDKDEREWAVAGENVSISLTSSADFDKLQPGDVVCPSTNPMACKDTFTLRAMAFEHLMPRPVEVHRGRLNAAGQIATMVELLDKITGEVTKKGPKIIQPGSVARIRIKLAVKVPLEAGQRIVLRGDGETIAAGLLE